MPLQPETVLNKRYRIVKLLGQGGYGAVYRAWDINLNRHCAVKENLNTSPEAYRQFAREATILANLSHPNLPRVTDHFTIPDQGQYLVMDFVEGEDLASLVYQQGIMSQEQAIEWISQVLDALAYLHGRQPPVVHRDVKPSNIRITPEGKAILVDFGLVKTYDPGMKTTLGARAVTPGYAPPEQYGRGSTDPRSDIYALGATLYNLLTGLDPMESVRRMIGGRMAPVSQVNPQIPVYISEAVERAMDVEPSQRFQTAAEFKTALHPETPAAYVAPQYGAQQPVVQSYDAQGYPSQPVSQARTPSVSYHPAREGLYPQPVSQEPEEEAAPPKTRRLAVGAGAAGFIVVCLAGLAILAGWYFSQGEPSQPTATPTPPVSPTIGEMVLFGPVGGSLVHDVDNLRIEADAASVNVRDFIVEARFFNPYAATEHSWDYGFIFRHAAENDQFRLLILSDGSWVLLNNTGDAQGIVLQQGKPSQLHLGANESNLVRLACQGIKGQVFINGVLVADLDLSARMNSGPIYIVTGVYEGDELAGKLTNYEGFTVWSFP